VFPSLVATMATIRFGMVRIRRAMIFGVVVLSLVMQPRSLRRYMRDTYLQGIDTIFPVFPGDIDDPSCHPPIAQGLVDWIDIQGNITKKKQLKLLSNIPRIYRGPVDFDIDPLLPNGEEDDDDEEYAALSFSDFQFALLDNNVSSVPLSDFTADQSWEEVSSSLSQDVAVLDTILCRIPNQRVWSLYHFPHFVQRFFPCWSILHALLEEPIVSSADRTTSWTTTTGTRFFIVFPESFQVSRGSYVDSLLQHITSRDDASTPTISIVYGNATLPLATEGESPSTVNLLIECTHSEGGWGPPVKYFMAPRRPGAPSLFYGVPQLQHMVLGNDLDSIFWSNTSFLQVLILDRIGSTRTISFVSEIQMVLEQIAFTTMPNHCDDTARMVRMFNRNDTSDAPAIRFNMTYIPSFTGWTVQDQARAMHQADIILSPHGAQLANAIFIRPCTVVLELYPYAYYVPFFPSLVRSAAGIPFVAYPKCYDRYSDRNRTMQDLSYRVKVRSVPLLISPHAIARNILPMVQSYIQCRCKRHKL
jgi:Glycosyltransferase 61